MAFQPQPGTGCIYLAPRFVNPTTNDFRLASNSPCIGAGEDGYDIGAYSYLARPSAVTNVQLLSDTYLTLQWQNPATRTNGSSLTDLSGIKIYRNDQLLTTVFTDAAGANMEYVDSTAIANHSYRYKFVAVNSADLPGWIFTTAEYRFQPGLLPSPRNLFSEINGSSVALRWNQPLTTIPQGYNIYRNDVMINDSLVTDPSFCDSDVEYNVQYSYYVTAVYGSGESEPSNSTVIYFALSSPRNLASEIDGSSIGLHWDEPLTVAAQGFNVYRNGVMVNDSLIIDQTFWDIDVEHNVQYSYYVTAVYGEGESIPSNTVVVTIVSTPTDVAGQFIFSDTDLHNYPNPFNPETNIVFALPEASCIELAVFNVKGQKVKTLVNESLNAGSHNVIWHGDNAIGDQVSSGIYWYQLKVDGQIQRTRKCLLMK